MAGFDYDLGGVKYRSERELSDQEVQKLYQDYEQAGLLNPEVQQQQQMMWKDVSQNKAILNAAKTYFEETSGEPWEGTPEELTDAYYEQMRYFEGNTLSMGTLVSRLNGAGDMSERERQSLAVMFGAWDNIVPFHDDDNKKWSAFLDHAEVNLLDPANLAGVFSFGTGTAASIAGKQVAKAAVRKTLLEGLIKNKIKSETGQAVASAGVKAAKSGALQATAVGTGLSAGSQEIRTELGMQDGIDWEKVGVDGAISGTLGGAIGGVIGMGGAGIKAIRGKADKATPNAPAIEKDPIIRPDMDSAQATAAASQKWREVLADPSITGEARQAARDEFLRNLGDTTRQRLDRNSTGVGHTVPNEQALANGVQLVSDLGIKITDDLTPEKLLNHLHDKYTKGDIALKDSTAFKAVVIKLENELYDGFLKRLDSNDGDVWAGVDVLDKLINLSEDLSTQSGRDLQLQKLRNRVPPSEYASLITQLQKKTITPQEAIAGLKLAKEKGPTWKGRTLNAVNEYWISQLLASATTLGVNTVSSMAHMVERNVIELGAGIKSGNTRQMRNAVNQVVGEVQAVPTALWHAVRTFNNARNSIDPGRAFSGENDDMIAIGNRNYTLSNLSPHNPKKMLNELKPEGESLGMAAMNLTGNIVRLVGSRGMLSTDELVKQIAFRGKLRADVIDMALERVGVDGGFKTTKEATQWANLELKRLIDEHIDAVGRGVQPEDPLLKAALNESREVTFQGDFKDDFSGRFGKMSNSFINKHPVFRQIAPFVRTPTNLISWASERTPGLQLLSKEFREALASKDPQVRARAEMAINIGTLYWTASMTTAMTGDLQGPGNVRNYNNQKVRETAGDLPYSILDDEGNRISIRRGDPAARFFMVQGAMYEALNYNHEQGMSMFVAAALTMAKTIFDVPSLTGVSDIVNLVGDAQAGKEYATSAFFEKRLKTMMPFVRMYNDKLALEEADREMFVNIGISPENIFNTAYYSENPDDPYDKRRDFLGRPIQVRENAGFALSGFAQEPKSEDVIALEMKRLSSNRNAPAKIRNGVDLTEIRVKPDGRQSVYDLWRELAHTSRFKGMRGGSSKEGATLEEALTYEMNSQVYKQQFGDAKRLERLNSIISQYESYVFDQVLPKVLPQEHELWKRTSFNKVQAMRGEAQVMDKFIDNNEQRLRELNSPLIGN
jgi:hypothetical protein